METRWLQLFAVVSRLLDYYNVVEEYIKVTENADSSRRFKRIVTAFRNPLFLPSLLFVRYIMGKLAPIEKSFQSDEVMIHRLFDELRQLFLEILLLCVKEKTINRKKP